MHFIFQPAEPTARAAKAAAKVVGQEHVVRDVPPRMGGKGLSFRANAVPGRFVRIVPAEKTKGTVPVHHPGYDFNDAILPIGASF